MVAREGRFHLELVKFLALRPEDIQANLPLPGPPATTCQPPPVGPRVRMVVTRSRLKSGDCGQVPMCEVAATGCVMKEPGGGDPAGPGAEEGSHGPL